MEVKAKSKNLKIKVPNATAFKFKTSGDLPKLHQNCIFVGARGSGKGVAMSNMIRMFQQDGNMDRVLVISPTFLSNKEILKDLKIDPEDVFDPDDKECIQKIRDLVQSEVNDLEQYSSEMKLYKQFQKKLESSEFISDDMLEAFYRDGDFKPPQHRWGGREPVLALIVDDCQGSDLFRSRKFQNMVIRHRHEGQFKKGGALGLSLFICLQNYKSQNGCPRSIRNNVTSLVLFKTKDKKTLDEVAEEVAGEIAPEIFMEVYERAIQGEHDFLFIDLHKKPEHPSMFRRNFDTFLMPP